MPFGLDIVPMALTFMLSGYCFQLLFKKQKLNINLFISIPFILALALTTFKIGLSNDANYVLMAENRYGNLANFFIVAIAGIIMSILIALIIEKYTKHLSNLLRTIGHDTMAIFILHKYPLQLINDLVILIPVTHISNCITIPVYLVFVLAICVPLSSFINKKAPFLIGK